MPEELIERKITVKLSKEEKETLFNDLAGIEQLQLAAYVRVFVLPVPTSVTLKYKRKWSKKRMYY